MRVIVYVEGRSDIYALQTLLRNLIEAKNRQGVSINFFEAQQGDKKISLLNKTPKRAVNILLNDPNAHVVIMPDLYPYNKGFPHENFSQLKNGILHNVQEEMRRKGISEDRINDYLARLQVFCFKHDMEVLLLASPEALEEYLGIKINPDWAEAVEDVNNNRPPKRVVEALFRQQKRKYTETIDAPCILEKMAWQYHQVARRCPQCFLPFVEFLEQL